MPDLRLPNSQTHNWKTYNNVPYLPSNLIAGGGASGRKIRQIFNEYGAALFANPTLGFAIGLDQYMTETKLENGHVFVDLWQVKTITELQPSTKNTPGEAIVTFVFCSHKHDQIFQHVTHVTTLTKRYISICEAAVELVRVSAAGKK